jgi:Tfp pilus assembly protein PilF
LRTKLGTLLRQVHELDRAREQYEAAVVSRPNYVPARILLGVTLFSMGHLDRAEEQWRKALEVDKDSMSAKMYLRMLATQRGKTSIPPTG